MERFNFINEPAADNSEEGAAAGFSQEQIRARKTGHFLRGSSSRARRTIHEIDPEGMAKDLLEAAREAADEARNKGE